MKKLIALQDVIVDRLFDNLHAVEDNFTPNEKEEVIDRLSNLLKRANA